jgi:hypothetical protein
MGYGLIPIPGYKQPQGETRGSGYGPIYCPYCRRVIYWPAGTWNDPPYNPSQGYGPGPGGPAQPPWHNPKSGK